MKKLARSIAIALLLVTGFLGLAEASEQFRQTQNALQSSVTLAVGLYGLLGLVGGVALFQRRPWSVAVALAWTIASTYAASVASFAYHDPTFSKSETITGTVAALISVALVGTFVVLTARAATRVPRSDASTHIPPS